MRTCKHFAIMLDMGYPANKKRNEEIVRLKGEGLTFEELGTIFKIQRQTVYKIYSRAKNKMAKNPDSKDKMLDYSVST